MDRARNPRTDTWSRRVDRIWGGGHFFLLLELITFGVSAAIIRMLATSISIETILFFRSLITFLLISLFIALSPAHRRLFFSPREYIAAPWIHLVRAVTGYGTVWAWSYSLTLIPLSSATFLYSSQSLFILLLCLALFGERINWLQGISILLCIFAVFIVTRPTLVTPLGSLMALTAAALSALVTIQLRWIASTSHPVGSLFVLMLFMTAISAIPLLSDLPPLPNITDASLLIILSLLLATSQFSLMIGLVRVGGPTTAIFAFGKVLVGVIVGITFFFEPVDPWLVCGAIVIFVAVSIDTVGARRRDDT
ncbi:EamA family transporter [Sinorhizobium medicae]|nr:EamA family transporter [Sinorhizobium medicae]